MSLPYYKFFPSDYLGNDNLLSLSHAEIGVFFLLVNCYLWQAKGKIPNNDEHLAWKLRLSIDQWLEIKRKFIDRDLITIKDDCITELSVLVKHEAAEDYSVAQALKRKVKDKKKLDRIKKVND